MSTWIDVAEGVNNSLTAAAIIAGGIFAYFKFVRGRVFHTRIDLALNGRPVRVAEDHAIHVDVIVTNAGTLKLFFPVENKQMLTIAAIDRPLWQDAVKHGEVLWTQAVVHRQDLLTREAEKIADAFLEPGEQIAQSSLIPLPRQALAYQIKLEVQARPQFLWMKGPVGIWERTSVVGMEESDVNLLPEPPAQ